MQVDSRSSPTGSNCIVDWRPPTCAVRRIKSRRLLNVVKSTTIAMPARQGRLKKAYFSQASTSSPARPQRTQQQTSGANTRRAGTDSQDEDEDDDDGNDSEGSAGINAIRLSESPDKKSAEKRKSTQAQAQGTRTVSELDSDDVLTPSRRKARQQGKEDNEAGPSGTSGLAPEEPEVIAIDIDDDDGDDEPVAPKKPSVPPPRKRVSLTAPGRGAFSSSGRPQPKTYTRIRADDEDVTSVSASVSDAATGSKRRIPYIELEKLTAAERAQYRVAPSTTSASASASTRTRPAAVGNKQKKLARGATQLSKVVEISDDESDHLPKKSASKSTRFAGVEQSSSRRVDLGSRKQAAPKAPSASRAEVGREVFDGIESADDDDGSDDAAPTRQKKVDKGKGKTKAKVRAATPEESDDEDYAEVDRNAQASQRKHAVHKRKATTTTSASASGPAADSPRKKRTDMSQRERDEMLAEIDLDEPKRFSSQTRLRKKKETPFQRKLRKLRAKKAGLPEPDTESDSDSDSDDDEDEESDSDSAPDSRSEDFIEDDGGVVADGVLPHEFSLSSAQTPEWKFKVVFHYFVLIVVNGTGVLPLTGENKQYMIPQLEDLRRKMEGFREQRVRSQIWSHELVKGLKKFPRYEIASLEYPEEHCVACNRRNFASTFRVHLAGEEYDRNTYEPLSVIKARQKKATKQKKKKAGKQGKSAPSSTDDDDDDESSSSSSDSDTGKPKLKEMECLLGAHCKKRTHVFHQMVHWGELTDLRFFHRAQSCVSTRSRADGVVELELYRRVRSWYNDILRAKKKEVPDDSQQSSSDPDSEEDTEERMQRRLRRDARRDDTRRRIKRLRDAGQLPDAYRDVDAIQDWMDEQGHILNVRLMSMSNRQCISSRS